MKRVLAFPLVRLALIVLAFSALLTLVVVAAGGRHSVTASVVVGWVVATSLMVATALVERFAAGRTLADIGLGRRGAIRDLALGLAFGAGLFSIVILELALSGHYRVTGFHVSPDLVVAALLLASGALTEEILFRGVAFRLIEEWAGTWIALAVSALIFGAVHAANPGASWVSTLAIALEAGILLAAAYVVTRSLWLPIGLHFGWNYFEGPVYGTQVSGHAILTSAFTAHVSGSAWLTGGSFGPEAGVYAVFTCLLAAVALLAYARRRSRIVAPSWKHRATV
jgi:uncharacterized protein